MNNDSGVIDKVLLSCIVTLLFSDAIAQPASARCSSRVWEFPTSILQSKISRCIYVCIACRYYEASQRAFQNLKIILQIRPSVFQVQLEADGYFFAQDFFAFASTASRSSWYKLGIFESDFTNPTSKTLVWLRPNPMFSTRMR